MLPEVIFLFAIHCSLHLMLKKSLQFTYRNNDHLQQEDKHQNQNLSYSTIYWKQLKFKLIHLKQYLLCKSLVQNIVCKHVNRENITFK